MNDDKEVIGAYFEPIFNLFDKYCYILSGILIAVSAFIGKNYFNENNINNFRL